MTYPPPPPPPPSPPAPDVPPPPPATAEVRTDDPAWPPLPRGWWRGTSPEATFPVPFTLADGFGLFAWFLLGQLIIALPLTFALFAFGVDPTDTESPGALVAVILTQAGVIVTGLGYLKLRGRLTWRLWGPIRPAWSHVGWGILVGVGGFLGIQVTLGLLLTLLGDTDQPQQQLLTVVGSDTLATVLVVLAAVVLAPIGEELFFRGILFQALRRRVGLWPAAVISSVPFGAVHVEVIGPEALPAILVAVILLCLGVLPRFPTPVRFALGTLGLAALAFAVSLGGWGAVLLPSGLAALGFVLAIAFHRTGNLLVPIVGHAVFNGIAISLTLVAQNLDLPV
ncbi:MAG: CPBP family intramembrane glutamic endopeptidase [Nitriliruptor sp.]|uniref:lysostaphin resistance A-like protein n=1 Tax=Nitriliruptor sp. TaxID=2448056 RepID=UPI0034A03E75